MGSSPVFGIDEAPFDFVLPILLSGSSIASTAESGASTCRRGRWPTGTENGRYVNIQKALIRPIVSPFDAIRRRSATAIDLPANDILAAPIPTYTNGHTDGNSVPRLHNNRTRQS